MGETAFSRILGRGRSGALAGWNPDNPIGLNPAWEQELRDLGVTRPNGSRGTILQAINEALLHSGASALDMAGKGVGAAYGGGVGALTGVAEELGAPRTEALERDLMAVPESVLGGLGGLGGMATKANGAVQSAQRLARNPQWLKEHPTSKRFVRGDDGSIDLGRIGPEVERASGGKHSQAPIRMQRGLSGPEGFGARHISPDKHDRAQQLGYGDGVDLIKDAAKNHQIVVEQINGRLMLVKIDGQNRYAIGEYRPQSPLKRMLGVGDDFYGVTTGFPDGKRQSKRGNTALKDAIEAGGKAVWGK